MSGFETIFSLTTDAFKDLTGPNGYGITMWFLALVFAWSGIVKLRQPPLAAMTIVDFGVARRVRPRLGLALGAIELLLSLALATRVFPLSSLSVATVLLWLFALLIARSLWSGESFACFCFGDADSQLSGLTLARTVGLALLSSLALSATPPDTSQFLSETNALQAIVASALLGIVVIASYLPGLLRWNRDPRGAHVAAENGGE